MKLAVKSNHPTIPGLTPPWGKGSLLLVENWSASSQAFSNRQVRPDVSLLPMMELPTWVLSQVASRVGSISIGKEGSAVTNEDLPEKAYSGALAPTPRSKSLLQSHSPLVTSWLQDISDTSFDDFPPSCVCILQLQLDKLQLYELGG